MSISIKIRLAIMISVLIACLSLGLWGTERFFDVKILLFDRTPKDKNFTPSFVIAKEVTIDDKSIRYDDLLGVSHKCPLKYLVFLASNISKLLHMIEEQSIFRDATSTGMTFVPKTESEKVRYLYVDEEVYVIEKHEDKSLTIHFDLKEGGNYRMSIWGRTDVPFSVYGIEVDGKPQRDPFTNGGIFFVNGNYFPKSVKLLRAFIPDVTTDYLHLEEGKHEIRLFPIANASQLFIEAIKVHKGGSL